MLSPTLRTLVWNAFRSRLLLVITFKNLIIYLKSHRQNVLKMYIGTQIFNNNYCFSTGIKDSDRNSIESQMLYLCSGHLLVTCRRESAVYQNANTYRSFIRRFDEY